MNVLLIFPHPDDETLFCGGTITRHIKNGDRVIWLCASFGERGGESSNRSEKLFYFNFYFFSKLRLLIPLQKLAVNWLSIFRKANAKLLEIRKKEAQNVAEILEIEKVIFLGISDMRFNKENQKLKEEIKKYIGIYKPQIIYTLHSNGITGHPDHITLSKVVTEITECINFKSQVLAMTIPESLIKEYQLPLVGSSDKKLREIFLNERELNKKTKAVGAYKSQSYLWNIFIKKYPDALRREYFIEL